MLNSLEKRLLSTSLSQGEESQRLADSTLETTLVAIEEGRYLDALRSECCAPLFAPPSREGENCTSSEFFAALTERVQSTWTSATDANTNVSKLLLAGVASLYVFIQTNLTGPVWKGPENVWEVSTWVDTPAPAHVPGTALQQLPRESADDKWARQQLQEDGEDVVGRYHQIQYLLAARVILASPLLDLSNREAYAQGGSAALTALASDVALKTHPSICVWAFRTLLTQQRMLDGHSLTLRAGLKALVPHITQLKKRADMQRHGHVTAALHVEMSLMEHAYTYVDMAKSHLEVSCKEAGLGFEVTGMMGLRTKFQVDAKPQLVVQTHSQIGRGEGDDLSGDEDTWQATEAPPTDTSNPATDADGNPDIVQQELRGIVDDSDVLVLPRLQDGSLPAMLGSVEQSILLGYSIHVKKGTATDELQPWEMAPYVEAVLAQPKSRFLLQLAARLFRARHERTRNRTRERSLLTMEQLGEAVVGPRGPPVASRMHYCFSVWFPLLPGLRKEIGEVMLGMGLIGAAMEIFERLELWDNLITCYRLLGKKAQAEDLVQKRLLEEPDEPKLWCALGDLTLNEDHYVTAWERSKHRNTRAQRSLAYAAHRKNEFARSAGHWELALGINPLYPQGWFALGHCYIKTQEYERALPAFTRCCQLEPDNGESWNNIAAVLMHLGRYKEGYNALGEAIKYKRDSWQTWENYAQCAVEARQFQQSCRSLIRVLDISQGSRLHNETLQKLAANYERMYKAVQEEKDAPAAAAPAATTAVADDLAFDFPTEMNFESDEDESGGVPETSMSAAEALSKAIPGEEDGLDARGRARLVESFGNLLLEVLKRGANGMSGNSDLWEAFARYYRTRGELLSEKECQLKRVRGLQGGQWLKEEDKFLDFASASLGLCKCYISLATGPDGRRSELAAGRMHLRSVLKQAEDKYGESEAYGEMKKMLETITQLEEQMLAVAAGGSGSA